MVKVWRVLYNTPFDDDGIWVTLDEHTEGPDADPLVDLHYPDGVLPISNNYQLVLWRDNLWFHYKLLLSYIPGLCHLAP